MPLQNRVDPFGRIHAVPSRGMFTGNRGIIHDPATKTLLKKRWSTKAWLICVCEFRGRRREVMGAHNNPKGGTGWTELFFLDEVTALAAGHRPCFYCRREAAKEFAGHFADVFRVTEPKVQLIDGRLHAERLASGTSPLRKTTTAPSSSGLSRGSATLANGAVKTRQPQQILGTSPRMTVPDLSELPDGAMVGSDGKPFAIRHGQLLPWNFDGYGKPAAANDLPDPVVLTPPTTLAVLRSGFRPVWHPSALS